MCSPENAQKPQIWPVSLSFLAFVTFKFAVSSHNVNIFCKFDDISGKTLVDIAPRNVTDRQGDRRRDKTKAFIELLATVKITQRSILCDWLKVNINLGNGAVR